MANKVFTFPQIYLFMCLSFFFFWRFVLPFLFSLCFWNNLLSAKDYDVTVYDNITHIVIMCLMIVGRNPCIVYSFYFYTKYTLSKNILCNRCVLWRTFSLRLPYTYKIVLVLVIFYWYLKCTRILTQFYFCDNIGQHNFSSVVYSKSAYARVCVCVLDSIWGKSFEIKER